MLTDELKSQRKGQADQRWKADEVLLKVKDKFHYLYRAIDSQGKLVEVKLSATRDSETTTAFFEQADVAPDSWSIQSRVRSSILITKGKL